MSGSQLNSRLCGIGLFHPKDPHNIGSVLRAAGCWGVSLIGVEGARYRRAPTDTTAAYRSIPLLHTDDLHSIVPFDCVPVAVELVGHAVPLTTYLHPKRAFYVFGPEDGTLGRKTLDWCRDVVQIPTNGCLNLAASVNVLLYDRMYKQSVADALRLNRPLRAMA